MEVELKEGLYLYCIIEESQYRSFGPGGIGERGDELFTICFKDIAAVVSNSPIKKYPVSRENVIPHEKAIEAAMEEYVVLPVRFATIAEDEKKVKKILEKEYDKFKDCLNKVRGKKELGLKAVFKEDVIYNYILEKYDDIRKLKQALSSKPSTLIHTQSLQIGKMVEAALEKEKENCKEDILNVLSPLAQEVKINYTYGERMIINAAFFVSKDKEAEFDKEVNGLDEKYGLRAKFKYLGTLPPFNFVNLVIETGKY